MIRNSLSSLLPKVETVTYNVLIKTAIKIVKINRFLFKDIENNVLSSE